MAKQGTSFPSAELEVRESWKPMIVIALGQMLLSFNMAALPVSMGGMVKSFDMPPTTVATAIVLYSLGVSGFIMLGAKLGQRFGSQRIFQVAVLAFGLAMLVMALSPNAGVMVVTQGLVGLTTAALVPTLIVLIAAHYGGKQQAEAVGWVGSAGAAAAVLMFILGGAIATFVSWRVTFGLIAVHAAVTFLLSFRLRRIQSDSEVRIDVVGVILSAASIILITFGFNNIQKWGFLLARATAPFDLLGASPAPAMVVFGIVLGMAFIVWTGRRVAMRGTPLLTLGFIDSPIQWVPVIALFCISGIEGAINFAVPLYVQIVQGRTSLETAAAMMPLMISVVFTAIFIVRLYERATPRQLGRLAFLLVMVGTAWLAIVVKNEWSTVPVTLGLITVGLGQGALMTLLFSMLVGSAPSRLAGDVGSLRGVTQNLAVAVGTSVVGALLVGLLSSIILSHLNENPVITAELKDEVNLTNLNFYSDDQLTQRLATTTANPDQLTEALHINADARTRALKIGFLALSGLAFLAVVPCSLLPDSMPGILGRERGTL
jgi:MFS family permease